MLSPASGVPPADLTLLEMAVLPGHLRVMGEESMEENGRYDVVTKPLL
jgi:hypothetical protein